MSSSAILACSVVVVVVALAGCNGDRASATKRSPMGTVWPADTIKSPDPTSLQLVKLSNVHFFLPAPPGLIARLPKNCRVKLFEAYRATSTKPETADQILPQVVATAAGGQLTWSLGVAPAADRPQAAAALEEELKASVPPNSDRVVRAPWIGRSTEGKMNAAVANLRGANKPRWAKSYFLASEDAQLILNADWPEGNEAARAEAIAAAEAFLATMEIDASATRGVTIFPGAGHEPNRPIPPGTEIALQNGMSVEATTRAGTITITAGPDSKRSYTWEGETRSAIMVPRGKRWHGSMGLYYPGPGDHWKDHHGITRGVLEEGQQHFKTEAEALAWLSKRRYMPYVYTPSGLVVGWMKTLERRQLSVEVWQLMINGNKPTNLKGAEPDRITITNPPSSK